MLFRVFNEMDHMRQCQNACISGQLDYYLNLCVALKKFFGIFFVFFQTVTSQSIL